MTRGFARLARGLAGVGLSLGLTLGLGLGGLTACSGSDDDAGDGQAELRSGLDTRLDTHALLPGTPTKAGLDYVRAVAGAHAQADAQTDPKARAELLVTALEREWPAGDGSAEVLYFDLAARTGAALLDADEPRRAQTLLQPILAPARSLPLDRACARGLVVLGDAAARTGDHDLAMSSYARALEVLSLLLEEVES